MRELELLKAGPDSQGDVVTRKCLEDLVGKFKPGSVPVTIGFDSRVPVGKVMALRLDGDRLMASVEFDDDGEKAAAGEGIELASGGTFERGDAKPPFTIKNFELTGAALTDKKVK